MLSGAYIDLPPAKEFSKPLPDCSAAGLAQLIPNIVSNALPIMQLGLMGYMAKICKFSRRYKWPSWILYDQHVHQEAGENGLDKDR